jgi:lipid-binding SYLF domain-containing protein
MSKRINLISVFCLAFLLLLNPLQAANDAEKRVGESTRVLKEILNIPEGIPQNLLDKAECVVIIPSVMKFAFGFGGSYGRGAMICRTGQELDGPWGPPSMFRLEGGSFGLQLGGSATDFVLLVVNPRGVDSLLKSKVKLGADAMAAAGPKGRSATAETDALMTAEILSYSRSRGLFAGVSLKGSTLRQDSSANEELYNSKVTAREIVMDGKVSTPASAKELVALLQKKSPKNLSN